MALNAVGSDDSILEVDAMQFAVRMGQRKPCDLGSTQEFRFFKVLADSNNKWVPHLEIEHEVGLRNWEARRLKEVKSRMIHVLRESGYGALVEMIKTIRGHYGLFFKGEIKMVGRRESFATLISRLSRIEATNAQAMRGYPMINPLTEEVVSLATAAKSLPARRGGKKPHISCLYRWSLAVAAASSSNRFRSAAAAAPRARPWPASLPA